MMDGQRKTYTILWLDGTFVSYSLTGQDYKKVLRAVRFWLPFVFTSIGVIRIWGIRHIIEQIEQPEREKPANPPLTDEEQAWLLQHGIRPDSVRKEDFVIDGYEDDF